MITFGPDEPLPSLHHNGALDPDLWWPDRRNLRSPFGVDVPAEGDLVGWRYAAWRVHEVRPYLDVDLTDAQRERLDKAVAALPPTRRAAGHAELRPIHVVLRHHTGPLIIKPGEDRGFKHLHDGTREVSFTSWPRRHQWMVLTDPHRVCSCHGQIWPCREYDQAVVTAHQMREMNRVMATAQPGVCANCLEPISSRQRVVTFPETSRLVPGAPGPSFHAGRAGCWGAAEKYERDGRLKDNPNVARLASCPGVRVIHEGRHVPADQRVECTAGPACTGHHGPSGYRRDMPCWHRVPLGDNEGAYARPGTDCGYRGGYGVCLGGDLSGGGTSLSPIAADLLWLASKQRGGAAS